MTIAEQLLPEYDQEMTVTRRVLERVPDDDGAWRPHPKSFPIAHLAQLVARMPSWIIPVMTQPELDIAPASGGQPYTIETTASLVELFDRNVIDGRAALAAGTDAQFAEPWRLLAAGHVVQATTRYMMLRTGVLNHLVHHRAQLGIYLRLRDTPVPGMYGPTADER
jgi:uncharacterized damage-inducible protein DinB